MFVIILLLLSTSIFLYLYVQWCRVRSFWAKKKVPHNRPHPILGSLTFLGKLTISDWMREIYKQSDSPYFGVWMFWRPALIINDPDLARKILVKDADSFRDRFLSSGKRDPLGGLNIFTVNDPLWSAVRKRLTTLYTSAKLKVLQGLMSSKANELVQRIKIDTENKKDIQLRTMYSDFTTDIIGTATFGIKTNGTLTGDCPMRRATKAMQSYTLWKGLGHLSMFFWPDLVDVFRFKFFPSETVNYLTKIFNAVIQQRGGFEKPVTDNKDLLDVLIKLKQEAKLNNNKDITDDVLLSNAAILVQGGFDTSALNMTLVTYELAHDPEVQEKLYQEVFEAKQRIGDAEFDTDTLGSMKYLDAVAKETLRKYPPMGWLDRISGTEYKVDDHLTIPAGTPVYINSVATQIDPKYFPDPLKFDPDRFYVPENEKSIVPYTYIPFGEGPRSCIGRRFAHLTVRYGLASIILNYKIKPKPGSVKPNDVKMEPLSWINVPSNDLSVDFEPRT